MIKEYRLRCNEQIRLDGGVTGRIVCCRQGVLWVTQTGNPGDHILRAGETFPGGGPGRLVIGALADSVCAVATPETDLSRLPRFLVQTVLRFARRFAGAVNLWA